MIELLIGLSVGAVIGFPLGSLLKGGANYSRGFDAGFSAGFEAADGEPLQPPDTREVIPAEGSPFVRDKSLRIDPADWPDRRDEGLFLFAVSRRHDGTCQPIYSHKDPETGCLTH